MRVSELTIAELTPAETENKLIAGFKVLLKLNLDYFACSLSQEPLAQLT